MGFYTLERINLQMKTAILVDGGFYRRRAQSLFGEKSAEARADELYYYCKRHLNIIKTNLKQLIMRK